MVKKDKKERKNLDVCMWLDDEPKVEEKMIYYIKADKKIKKYDVEIDIKKLDKLETKILLKCDDSKELLPIIERIKQLDTTVIDEIYSRNKYEKQLLKEKEKITKKLYNNSSLDELHILEQKLSYILNDIEQFEQAETYFEKLRKCISFKLIDTISIKEVEKVNEFYGYEDITMYGKTKVKRLIDKNKKK